MLKEEVNNFSKMWTWLYEHPGHDQLYYMKNVVKLTDYWNNGCPLSNNEKVAKCDGCAAIWNTGKGSLCTDSESPLSKWIKVTAAGDADKRSYYAARLTMLIDKNLSR